MELRDRLGDSSLFLQKKKKKKDKEEVGDTEEIFVRRRAPQGLAQLQFPLFIDTLPS